MKKILAIVLTVCMLLSLVGCGKKAYKAKAAEFSSDGITITLTKAFKEKIYEGYTVCYDSKDVAVFILKESYSLNENYKDMTVERYAYSVRNAISDKKPTQVTRKDGLVYMEYEFNNEGSGTVFKYFAAMYKGVDAFWLVQFACDTEAYSEYFPYFVQWAKTVNVSNNASKDGDQREQV